MIGLFLILFPILIQPDTISSHQDKLLFYIERSKDDNRIMYEVNLDENGRFIKEHPLNIYWIKATKNNRMENLTWIQNKYAYGIKIISSEEDKVVFQFAPYNQKDFTLSKTTDGYFLVTGEFEGKDIALEKIFIQIDGGSFWVPNITKIDVHGACMNSQQQYISTIHP